MSKANCLCQKRSIPLTFPLDYPTLEEGQDPVKLLNEYGFFLLRGTLGPQEVEDGRAAVSEVCKKWYAKFLEAGEEGPDWEEVANRRPAWKEGKWQPEPGQEELGFRRLYRMTELPENKEFFINFCRHHKVRH